uniref:Uncharacterized protein n=1 Tax=Vespula pensylvanica TaxID=30213 RepID=A0A834PGI2_VESPE|nr:hypothetical protein H0235_001644 [Vespula pensylvanica]
MAWNRRRANEDVEDEEEEEEKEEKEEEEEEEGKKDKKEGERGRRTGAALANLFAKYGYQEARQEYLNPPIVNSSHANCLI